MSTSLYKLSEIKGEFLVRQNTATTVSGLTDAILNDWADQGHKYAATYKKWPMTEGRASTTYASLVTDEDGMLRGSYPEGWKPRSIRMIQVGGKTYDKTNFMAFRKFLDMFPSASDRKWTDYGFYYYLNAGAQGSGTVVAFGQYTPAMDTTDEDATTVFSGVDENGNLAIVELMQSYAMTKEKKPKEANEHLLKAHALLDIIWKNIEAEGYAYQTPENDGMFKRIDVMRGSLRDDLFKRDQFT